MPPTLNQRSRKGKTEAEAEGEAWQAATGALVLSLLGPRGQNEQQECPEDNGESVAPRMLEAVAAAVVAAVAVAVAVGIKAEQSAERNRQVSRWRGSTGATAASPPLRRRAQKRCRCYFAFVCSLCWVVCRRASVVWYFWRLREPVYGKTRLRENPSMGTRLREPEYNQAHDRTGKKNCGLLRRPCCYRTGYGYLLAIVGKCRLPYFFLVVFIR